MSNKIQIVINKFRNNYFNILFFLIMPAFVMGQFIFKSILVIIIFSGILLLKTNIFKIQMNLINILFLFMMVFFSLNSLIISNYYYFFNERFFLYILIILLFLISVNLVKYNYLIIEKVFISYVIIFLLIYADTIYQFIYLKDLFGFSIYQNYERFAGPFGDEFILGAFMSFFLLPSILFLIIEKKNTPLRKTCIFIFFIVSLYVALKSGERIAFFTIILQFILISFFLPYSKKIKYFFLPFIILCLFLIVIILDKGVAKKYNHFVTLLLNYNSEIIVNSQKNVNSNKFGFLNTQTGAHFLTGIEIWKNHPIFGVGIKNFRHESSKEIYSNLKTHHVEYRVSTHPHNYQIEILSETGLIGFIIFNLFILTLLFKIYKIKSNNKKKKFAVYILLIVPLSKYFPFKSDPSLFSSSLGLLFWIFIIFTLSCLNNLDEEVKE